MLTTLFTLALAPKFIDFSGHRWEVRDSVGAKQGPGPNVFSGTEKDVWIDSKGYLHLAIRKTADGWRCASVTLDRSLGYGTYKFTLGSRVDALDPQTVVGLFTWDDDEEDAHRELDIEFSRWGDPLRSNGQFVVQPYETLSSTVRFELPALISSIQQFEWLPESAGFVSKTRAGKIIAEHVFVKGIPRPGKERAMINLWLYEGKPPRDGKPLELIVERFDFTPAPVGKRKATENLAPTGP